MFPRRFFWFLDFLVLSIAFLGAYNLVPQLGFLFAPDGLLRQSWLAFLDSPADWTGQLPPVTELLWLFLTVTLVTLVVLGISGNHGPLLGQSSLRILVGCILAPVAGLALATLALFALKSSSWSRLFVFSFGVLSALSLWFYRLALRRYFLYRQATGHYARNVLLIGLMPSIEWAICYFAENVSPDRYRLFGYLRVRPDQPSPTPNCNIRDFPTPPLEVKGNVEQLGDLLISQPIQEVIAFQPISNAAWIRQVIQDCDYMGVLLRIVPESLLFEKQRASMILYPFEPLHLPAVVLTPPHWDSDALFVKRLFDIVGSAALLALLAPVMGAIALIVKLAEPGSPVLYPWRVIGQNGVPFTGYKFRTMIPNADDLKAQLMEYNEMTGPVFKMTNDPRVTRIGHVLRKYSLDELPQLWSVLKGDMSLVGPRPAGPHELERYEFWHKRKLSIRPGMTCLWQIRGRNAINNFDEWVKMDLEYIDKWSLWMDLKILVGTGWAVIAGTGV